MKKSTMTTIANYIQNVPELAAEYAELSAELAKGEEKAKANRELYNAAREVVLSHLASTPMTVATLYEAIKDELPKDMTKSKVQYGLSNYWTDAVVKIENPKGPNEYRRKV